MYSEQVSYDKSTPEELRVRIRTSLVPHLSEFSMCVDRQMTVEVLKKKISGMFQGFFHPQDLLMHEGRLMAQEECLEKYMADRACTVVLDWVATSETRRPVQTLFSSTQGQDHSLGSTSFLGEKCLSVAPAATSFPVLEGTRLPIFYQAAVVNHELCLLKVSKDSSVSVLKDGSWLSVGNQQGSQLLLVPSSTIPPSLHSNEQPSTSSLNSAIPSDAQTQLPNMNQERLRMTLVHVWLFIRLAFFVGLFSVNSSWIRFCTLVIIALQFFFWHTGRLVGIRQFFQRIIHRERNQNNPSNERSPLNTDHGSSQSTTQEDNDSYTEEFNWRRSLGHKILTFIISLFPITE